MTRIFTTFLSFVRSFYQNQVVDHVIGFKHEIPELNANFGALYERFEP